MQSVAELCGMSMMSNGMGLELNYVSGWKRGSTCLGRVKQEFKESFCVRVEKWKFILLTEIPIEVTELC